MYKVPEMYRMNMPGTPDLKGTPRGAFLIPIPGLITQDGEPHLFCVGSNGMGWEHVSITVKLIRKDGKQAHISEGNRLPTWEEMCRVKDLFWDQEDTVVQFHPPKSQYVNCHKHCLHLWRPAGINIPTPHPALVGPPPKGGSR